MKLKASIVPAALTLVALTACGSSGSSNADAPAKQKTTTTTTVSNTGSGSGTVNVDLTIAGDRPATIKGTSGECLIATIDGVKRVDGYEFLAADYPSLGAGGFFDLRRGEEGNNPVPDIKASIGGDGFFSVDATGITISADGKSVTLDSALTGGSNGAPLTGQVTGTIVCG